MLPRTIHTALRQAGYQRRNAWASKTYDTWLSSDKELLIINPNYGASWSIPKRIENCAIMAGALSNAGIANEVNEMLHYIVVRLK